MGEEYFDVAEREQQRWDTAICDYCIVVAFAHALASMQQLHDKDKDAAVQGPGVDP